MLSPSVFKFPLLPEKYASQPVPTLQDWQSLWASWDLLTRYLIPDEDLLSKPIKLRNCPLFYLGHIPTFLDIHLTRATSGKPTEPAYFTQIFERGIDPDVDNPENCHAHSEIPDTWPPLDDILAFQNRVRERVTSLYETRSSETDRRVGRALWLGFEHEGMVLDILARTMLTRHRSNAS